MKIKIYKVMGATIMDFRNNIYSQNGEDGVIQEIFNRLGIESGQCCEFGSADGFFMSNTRALIDKGWSAVLLEAKNGQFVTPENVNELVPQELDLLSIDIDGNDYMVWKAYQGNAKVVVIEINSGFPPGVIHFSLDKGCSYEYMKQLGESKGYTLLCHTGNLVFIQSQYADLFPDRVEKFDESWI